MSLKRMFKGSERGVEARAGLSVQEICMPNPHPHSFIHFLQKGSRNSLSQTAAPHRLHLITLHFSSEHLSLPVTWLDTCLFIPLLLECKFHVDGFESFALSCMPSAWNVVGAHYIFMK